MKKDINWKSITTKPQSTVLQPDCHFSLLGHVTLYSIYNVVSTTFKLQSCIFLKPKKTYSLSHTGQRRPQQPLVTRKEKDVYS